MELGFGNFMGVGLFTILFVIIAIWSLTWKGFALWISARESKKWWFIPILLLNTAGILEIIYIFFFTKNGKDYVKNFKEKYFKKRVKKEKENKVEEVVENQ